MIIIRKNNNNTFHKFACLLCYAIQERVEKPRYPQFGKHRNTLYIMCSLSVWRMLWWCSVLQQIVRIVWSPASWLCRGVSKVWWWERPAMQDVTSQSPAPELARGMLQETASLYHSCPGILDVEGELPPVMAAVSTKPVNLVQWYTVSAIWVKKNVRECKTPSFGLGKQILLRFISV